MSETAKILLVDDEPGMLRYIKTLLEVDDYKVETASTGEEALQRIEKGLQPDLVLLDVLCRASTAWKLSSRFAQNSSRTKSRDALLRQRYRKVVQAMRLGAQDYLTKPFQKAELDAVIDQCLETREQNFRAKSKSWPTMFSSSQPVRQCGKSARRPHWSQRRYSGLDARGKRNRQRSSGAADSQAIACARIAHF